MHVEKLMTGKPESESDLLNLDESKADPFLSNVFAGYGRKQTRL